MAQNLFVSTAANEILLWRYATTTPLPNDEDRTKCPAPVSALPSVNEHLDALRLRTTRLMFTDDNQRTDTMPD